LEKNSALKASFVGLDVMKKSLAFGKLLSLTLWAKSPTCQTSPAQFSVTKMLTTDLIGLKIGLSIFLEKVKLCCCLGSTSLFA
jgi:hypothetical protein